MTLESWSMGIVRPTMELFPWSWIFFVPFIIITSFAVLNLFIGIIVDAMSMAQEEPREQDKQDIKDFTAEEINQLHDRLDILQKEIATLQKLLKKK
jgi:voltage-gated sodium channel